MKPAVRRFTRDETGAMTIEFVLWIPIIVALLTILIDATSLYVTHTEMWKVARDTARRMVTGKVRTEADAEAYALASMRLRGLPYVVDASYDAAKTAQVSVMLATADLSIMGVVSPMRIFGTTMEARVVMRPDPRIPFGETGGGGNGNNE